MKATAMNSRSHKTSPSYRSILKKGHTVMLSSEIETFRLGQRVYFHADARSIVIQDEPQRVTGGRLLSSRIRRVIRTLAAFGPRPVGRVGGCRRPISNSVAAASGTWPHMSRSPS
jgi:hypothetical protein